MRVLELFPTVLVEGGHAFEKAGTIHISEINPTLDYVSDKLGLPNLKDNTSGSAGKQEYSGDIDVVVKINLEKKGGLIINAKNILGQHAVRKGAGGMNILVPIQNFDKSKNAAKERTGYVQIDFFLTDEPNAVKLFYHSPGSESQFKGYHRNIAIAAVAREIQRDDSDDVDDMGRPNHAIYWTWSPKKGLVKTERTGRQNPKTGQWYKKQDKKELTKAEWDPQKISKILFRGKAGAPSLNSLESVLDAAKKTYSEEEMQRIYQYIAKSIKDQRHIGTEFNYPEEIQRLL